MMSTRTAKVLVGLSAVALSGVALVPGASAVPANPNCGDTITVSVILQSDLDCSGQTPAPGSSLLVVGADHITIDLTGHSIIDNDDGYSKIIEVSGRHHVTIKNGSTVGGSGSGIHIAGSSHVKLKRLNVSGVANIDDTAGVMVLNSNRVHLHDLNVTGNGDDGVYTMSASKVHVHKVTSSNNSDDGFDAEVSSELDVKNSTFSNNGGDGIEVDDTPKLHLHGVKADNNAGDGFDIDTSNNAKVHHVSAAGNDEDGLEADGDSNLRIHKSEFSNSGDDGMDIDDTTFHLDKVTANANADDGIFVEDVASFRIKHVRSTSNGGDGVDIDDNDSGNARNYVIEHSVSNGNADYGFEIENPVTGKKNSASGNVNNNSAP